MKMHSQGGDKGWQIIPYDFGNGYKVQTVFANKTETSVCGDIYDFKSDAERAHPDAEILTGYCVISEATGFVADGCNDWNDTISAAIQDFDDHIIPLLERDERLEMNCPVYDEEDNFLYEAFFTAKCGWLQDYFGVDNRAQLEVLWDIADSWEDPENFTDALEDAEHSGFQIKALVRDNVKVEWLAIGEGLHGDYDSDDPQDIELLRFSVSVLRDGAWEEKEDTSYCTQFPASSSAEEQVAGLQLLLGQFYNVLSSNIDISIKKLAEKMSWLDTAYVSGYMNALASPPSPETAEPNPTDSLIKAMVTYGMEHSWSDGEIIHALTNLGITYDDFCHAGAQDYVKDYLEAPVEKDTSTPQKVQYGIDDNWMHRGQKVKILAKPFEGQIGTVHAFMWTTGQYTVTMENGHNLPFMPSELEKADEVKLSFSKQVQAASIRASKSIASTSTSQIVVKTWCESTQEAEEYLKLNGYKNAKRIGKTDLYEVECIGLPLRDVEILDANILQPLSETIRSVSNLQIIEHNFMRGR